MKSIIVINGPMVVGKSTVSRNLCKKLIKSALIDTSNLLPEDIAEKICLLLS